MIDRAEVSGYIVLLVGVALLVFTFINAYFFLVGVLGISIGDWVAELGDLLGPLVETCIRIMYLGIMGWIGALLTKRGIEFLTKLPREAKKEGNKKEAKKEVEKEAKKKAKKKAAVQGKKS
jgi:hypothetical protein